MNQQANLDQQLARIERERNRWLQEPQTYCDWEKPLCRLGWSDLYAEEAEILAARRQAREENLIGLLIGRAYLAWIRWKARGFRLRGRA